MSATAERQVEREYPAWVVETESNPTSRPIAFSDLKAYQQDIVAVALIWPTHSSRVGVRDRFFVINGGFPIKTDTDQAKSEAVLEYVRRQSQNVSLIGNNNVRVGGVATVYLIGYKYVTVDGVEKTRLVEISQDGTTWKFRDHK